MSIGYNVIRLTISKLVNSLGQITLYHVIVMINTVKVTRCDGVLMISYDNTTNLLPMQKHY